MTYYMSRPFRGLQDMTAGTKLSDASSAGARIPIICGALAPPQHWDLTRRSWCWPDSARAPVASVVDDATNYLFDMQGSGTPDMEIPWLVGKGATDANAVIDVQALLAAKVADLESSLWFHGLSKTLVTTVTTTTGSFARVSPASRPLMRGWLTDGWIFYHARSSIYNVASLSTTRQIELKFGVNYVPIGGVPLEAGGDDPITMQLDVYMAKLLVRDLSSDTVPG